MATLYDALQQVKSSAPRPQQEELQSLARTAQTGKARKGVGPKASNVAETQALQAGQAGADALNFQGGMAGQQLQTQADQTKQQQALQGQQLAQQKQQALAGLAQQRNIGSQQLGAQRAMAGAELSANERMQNKAVANRTSQALQKLATDKNIAVTDLFQNFRHSNQELADRKDAAELEQLGFAQSLSDQAYLDSLARIGKERNLGNSLAFESEMNDLIYGENLVKVMEDIDLMGKLKQSERDLKKDLANMGFAEAVAIARAETRGAATGAMIGGLGGLVKAGFDYAEKDD